MFEFFIALFGGIYLIYKFTKDKNASKAVDREVAERRSYIDHFNEIYANNEASLEVMFNDGRMTADKVYDLIGDDLKEIYGENYKEKIPLPGTNLYNSTYKALKKIPYPYSKSYDPIVKAEYLLLSKRGKVPYQYGGDSDWFPLGFMQMFTDEEPFEVINQNIELFKKIESNLKTHSVNVTFVGMPDRYQSVFMNNNVRARIAIYELLEVKDKQKSKRLW